MISVIEYERSKSKNILYTLFAQPPSAPVRVTSRPAAAAPDAGRACPRRGRGVGSSPSRDDAQNKFTLPADRGLTMRSALSDSISDNARDARPLLLVSPTSMAGCSQRDPRRIAARGARAHVRVPRVRGDLAPLLTRRSALGRAQWRRRGRRERRRPRWRGGRHTDGAVVAVRVWRRGRRWRGRRCLHATRVADATGIASAPSTAATASASATTVSGSDACGWPPPWWSCLLLCAWCSCPCCGVVVVAELADSPARASVLAAGSGAAALVGATAGCVAAGCASRTLPLLQGTPASRRIATASSTVVTLYAEGSGVQARHAAHLQYESCLPWTNHSWHQRLHRCVAYGGGGGRGGGGGGKGGSGGVGGGAGGYGRAGGQRPCFVNELT